MVSVYGMSKYGLLNLEELHVPTSELIAEYQTISQKLEAESMAILTEHRDLLDKLANTLIERETLEEAEVLAIFENNEEVISDESND